MQFLQNFIHDYDCFQTITPTSICHATSMMTVSDDHHFLINVAIFIYKYLASLCDFITIKY